MTDWLGKPYYSLDAYLKKTFGEKVYKLSLDGGMTCPNRDGTCGDRGCIFCSAGGSGDFAGDRNKSIPEQIREQKSLLQQKRPVHKFIAYFQAYTNTYAPVEYLEKIFREAISDEEVVVLSIGTRPDCLGEEVLSLLEELNRIKPVWVELGLQTMHEKTAQYIRRGYPLSCFEQAVNELHRRGDSRDCPHDPRSAGGGTGRSLCNNGLPEWTFHFRHQASAASCAEKHGSCGGLRGRKI